MDQVWDGLYTQLTSPSAMTNLPRALRDELDLRLPPALTPITESSAAAPHTGKLL